MATRHGRRRAGVGGDRKRRPPPLTLHARPPRPAQLATADARRGPCGCSERTARAGTPQNTHLLGGEAPEKRYGKCLYPDFFSARLVRGLRPAAPHAQPTAGSTPSAAPLPHACRHALWGDRGPAVPGEGRLAGVWREVCARSTLPPSSPAPASAPVTLSPRQQHRLQQPPCAA